jgi:hypothetical protein
MIFDKLHFLFWIRIRFHNLKLRIRIRILQTVSDPYGSGSGFGSTTLVTIVSDFFKMHFQLYSKYTVENVQTVSKHVFIYSRSRTLGRDRNGKDTAPAPQHYSIVYSLFSEDSDEKNFRNTEKR